ncbi:MAG: AraC family transcriptional regulator [Peptoniphilus sp.]|nr:AraC family transcriptional regulator [Peptoniphilus sp.]MDD7363522.1 AraC family transcriptional regulator [Bacillota bacterium]MDY6044775.1 AraC family transcriptional regulator [Peptoniphilus sp.]
MFRPDDMNLMQDQMSIVHFKNIIAEDYATRWSVSLHKHDFLELSLITDGEGELEYGQTQYPLQKGILVVKNVGMLHSEVSSLEKPIREYCLGVTGVQIPGRPANCLLHDDASPILNTGSGFQYLEQSFRFLLKLFHDEEASHDDEIHAILIGLAGAIQFIAGSQPRRKIIAQTYSELVEDSLSYIEENFQNRISVNGVAEHFHVSPSTLSHKFKDEVGYTVKQYILELQLGEAERRLIFSNEDIRVISEDCGYSNLQYFYNVFKKSTGYTPIEFREFYQTSIFREMEEI